MRKIIFAMAVVMVALAGRAVANAPQIDLREAWKNMPGQFAKAAMAGAGFSFKYGDTMIGPQIPGDWQHTTSHDAKSGVTQTLFRHGSGLLVTREMRVFPKFDAVEYKLRFKNTAARPLPPISMLRSIDLSFDQSMVNGNCVVSSGGGMATGTLPPKAFAIRRSCFAPTTSSEGVYVDLATEGGRSSNKDLPFFFIDNVAKGEGVFIAFGWSGQWRATIAHYPANTLTVKAKIPDIEIALEPGEEIEGPTALVGLYRGALETGSNRLRRLIREIYTPQLAGTMMMPVSTYDFFFGHGDKFDDTLVEQVANGAAALDQEYFLLDAGWYEGTIWFDSVGNWERVSPKKLPNGLKPVADYVRSKGLKFGLWFEPERVAPDTDLAREHPDWILWRHEQGKESLPAFTSIVGKLDIFETPLRDILTKPYGLLDYGRPEVQLWVRNMMDRYIRENGIKYIRYDFNIDPLPFWDANDAPNRRGITQLRHIQGFYAVIDWLRERHPDVVLEGCASGGRRIDLETARRFHTFWISDYTIDPSIVRFHLFGLNYFLPGNYSYIQYNLPSGWNPTTKFPDRKEFQPDDLGFQSLFGGAFGLGGRVDLWPQYMRDTARRHIALQKKLRRYLVEDYYPLSPQPADLESWSGWQFHDPQDRSGFVQTFRTRTTQQTHRFRLKGLNEQTRYRFTDGYGDESFEMTGEMAMSLGVDVKQESMSSKVLLYKEIKP